MCTAPYCYIDVLDERALGEHVVNQRIDWLVHFSAVLSAVGEANVPLALRINIDGLHNVLSVARQHAVRVFVPSTIGAFGPTSPRVNTPDICTQRPRTIYGVSKVHAELLGEVRASTHAHTLLCSTFIRASVLISVRCAFRGSYRQQSQVVAQRVSEACTSPRTGYADYAIAIFYDALQTGEHKCYLRPDTRLPMMYIDDCLRSVVEVCTGAWMRVRTTHR
jgi:threonine 3-dehydrogenase